MKPSYLTGFAILATLAAGYVLVEYAQNDREVWIAMGAWVLGFWFASGVNGMRSQDQPEPDDDLYDEQDDEQDDEADEDAEEEEWEDDDMSERD